MQINSAIKFFLRSAVLGLAGAFLVVWFKPEWIKPEPLVPFTQPPELPTKARNGTPVGSYADAVALATPAVVNIYTATKVMPRVFEDPFTGHKYEQSTNPRFAAKSLGSGVIFNKNGYILTNNHVISGADRIFVMLADGRTAIATLIGSDPPTDLAILHIGLKNLPTIQFGNSKQLRVGDVVLAIGNPYGVGQTVTQGIISAKGRNLRALNSYEEFIQTDAAINPGNSGGAIINAEGRLVGIASVIFSPTGASHGIGFAIPVDLAQKILTSIITHGRVIRGWLGITMDNITPEIATANGLSQATGVIVTGIYLGGPAHLAGLRPFDLVTALNNVKIKNAFQLLSLEAQVPPETRVRIEGIREGRPFTTEALIKQRPAQSKR